MNWRCLFGLHQYTCKAWEGIKPTSDEVAAGIDGWWVYSQPYCKRCGKHAIYVLHPVDNSEAFDLGKK